MALFGFKYSPVKKSYYVDRHEKPDTVLYWRYYTKQYIKDELWCFRWVQLTLEEVEEVEKENKDFVRESAYVYNRQEDGLTMFEFHVDELNNKHVKIDNLPFGGYLSVRKKSDEKPISFQVQVWRNLYRTYLISITK